MRNAKAAAFGLMTMGLLLATTPATAAGPADTAERTITMALPGGPVAQLGPDAPSNSDAASIYVRLTKAAGLYGIDDVRSMAVLRLGKSRGAAVLTVRELSELAPSLADGRIDAKIEAKSAEPGEADQYADAAVDIIRDRVNRAWDEIVHIYKESLPKVKQQAADASAQLAKAREQITAGEAQLRERTGRIDLSAAGIQAAADALELERQKIELDLAGLKARRAALQDAIAEQAAKAAASQKEDPAVQAMARAVDASKQRLDVMRKMVASGTASPAEVSQAEVAELEAEAKLAERRNTAGGSTEALSQWTRALTEAAIEQQEKRARLDAATNSLAAMADTAAARKALQSARDAEASASQQLATAERRLRDVTAWLQRYGNDRPVVTVRRAGTPTTAPAGE